MTGRIAALAIAAVVAGLALVNVALHDTPVDITPIASGKGYDGALTAAKGSLQFPEAGDLGETFQRPLFTPTRRKFAAQPVEQASVELDTTAVEQLPHEAATAFAPSLMGVSIHGGVAKALLRVPGSGSAAWYGNGETAGGWTVSVIDRNQIVLERDGEVARVPLYPQSNNTPQHLDPQHLDGPQP